MESQKPKDQESSINASLGNSNPDVERLREILKQQSMPFYLQVLLNKGETIVGQPIAERTGFTEIYSDPSLEKHLMAGFGPTTLQYFIFHKALKEAKEGLPRNQGTIDKQCVAAALVHLPAGSPTETLFALEYTNIRPDDSGRFSPCIIMLYLPASLANSALKALSASPQAALGIILGKIDPNLHQIAPINDNIRHFNAVETTFVSYKLN